MTLLIFKPTFCLSAFFQLLYCTRSVRVKGERWLRVGKGRDWGKELRNGQERGWGGGVVRVEWVDEEGNRIHY